MASIRISSIITLFKAIKNFGFDSVASKGFGNVLKQIDDVGSHTAEIAMEQFVGRLRNGEFSKAIAFEGFHAALGQFSGGSFAITGFLPKIPTSAFFGGLAAGAGALVGFDALKRKLDADETAEKAKPEEVDLSTGVRSLEQLGVGQDGIAFSNYYGALTLELGGPNHGGHYAGVTHTIPVFVDIDERNLIGTQYDDKITSSDAVNNGHYIDGGAGDDFIDGGGGNDVLIGGDGNDTIDGGADDDLLIGGAGADALDGGSGIDTVDYTDSGEGVTIDLAAGTGKGGDAQGDSVQNIENVIGSKYDDVITGGDEDNALFGGQGNDTLRGGRGDDYLYGGDGHDVLEGGEGDDFLSGNEGADVIDGGAGTDAADYGGSSAGVEIDLTRGIARGGDAEGDVLRDIESLVGSDHDDILSGDDRAEGNVLFGGAGNDRLFGRGGNDLLEGGAGADLIDGGEGIDTADYTASDAAIEIDLASGQASGGHAAGDVLHGIEDVIGSGHNDVLRGDDVNNALVGGAGNDTLEGRAGDDVLFGDDGDDVLDGGDGQDLLYGGDGADRLAGGTGDDVLEGGAGADVIIGGDGNDTASYAYSTGSVFVDLAQGTVFGGDAYGDTLSGIENLVGGRNHDNLYGDAGTNWLSGGDGNDLLEGRAGDDILSGGAGADILHGGDGIDTAEYSGSGSGVTVDLSLGYGRGGDAHFDTLDGIENVVGSLHDDVLVGNLVANQLFGWGGNDRLDGGDGADTLDGGDGIDTADYARSGAGVTVNLAAGTGSGGYAEDDRLIDIENVNGSAHADTIIGDAKANRLAGGADNDVLDGGAGDDVLTGGSGSDLLRGGEGSDTVDYSDATGDVTIELNNSYAYDGQSIDRLESIENAIGSGHNDLIWGTDGVNRLAGGAGRDILLGFAGDDILEGGEGNDKLDGGSGIDTAVYANSREGVEVNLATGRGRFGDAAGDELIGIENVLGSAHADTIIGDAVGNVIEGGAGADTIDGGAGSDTARYAGSKAGVVVDLAAGTASGGDAEGDRLSNIENIEGSAHADILRGDTGANRLSGGAGDDVLAGGAGGDWLDGGDGIDTADYSAAKGRVVVGLNVNPLQYAEGGVGYEGDAAGDRLFDIENLIGSSYNDLLHGDDGANRIEGGLGDDHLVGAGGDDILVGGEGQDRLDGGDGIDTAEYSAAKGRVVVGLNVNTIYAPTGGIGYEGEATGDRLVNIENLIGSAYGDFLHGDNGANRLDGGAGDDRLTGSRGADVLVGGLGNDTAAYNDSASGVTVDLAAGTGQGGEAEGDRLEGIENLEGSAHDDVLLGDHGGNRIVGGAGNDTLNGRDGDDVLIGGEGADWLDGGDGIDTADYSAATAGVFVALSADPSGLGGEAAGDRLINIENLLGSAHNDRLHGDHLANRIEGGAGNDEILGGGGDDWLIGGAGADRIIGGAGIDTADYSASRQGINLFLHSGYVSGGGDAQGDVLVDVENAIGTDFDDSIAGGSENNRLEGGKGNDALFGGNGDDWLIGGEGADRIDGGLNEIGGTQGFDTVDYSASKSRVEVRLDAGRNILGEVQGRGWGGDAEGDTLDSIEAIVGSAFSDKLVGDSQDNNINGGSGDDAIEGGGGHDVLVGGAGDDQIVGGDGDDIIYGGDGNDVIRGDNGNDWIAGGDGADELHGGAGIDTADYGGSDGGVQVDLRDGTGRGGHAQGDTLEGIDSLIGSDFADILNGNQGANYLQGNGGNDKLYGHAGDDALYAGDGDDLLEAGSGNDQLVGGAGNDRLIGGTGDDQLEGNAGIDTFHFSTKEGWWGNDHIWDLTDEDLIELEGISHSQLDQVLANAVQSGDNVVLTFQSGTITLHNKDIADLSVDQFAIG